MVAAVMTSAASCASGRATRVEYYPRPLAPNETCEAYCRSQFVDLSYTHDYERTDSCETVTWANGRKDVMCRIRMKPQEQGCS